MERIKALIDKLYQQKEQNGTPAQLLLTVQLLHTELLQFQQQKPVPGSSKVAVTLPVNVSFAAPPPVEESSDKEVFTLEPLDAELEEAILKQEALEEELARGRHAPSPYSLRKPAAEDVPAAAVPPAPQPEPQPEPAPTVYTPAPPVFTPEPPAVKPEPVVQAEEPTPPREAAPQPAPEHAPYYPSFPAFEEAPTLAQHQPPAREVHELLSEKQESLNDRLKQEKTELVHTLKDTPIKDLRKGVGINDRFTFVNELFRGDEAMYERSIKTINNFSILPEAEYWISRELKYKLGWDDSKPAVQHFYHLVRRRFS